MFLRTRSCFLLAVLLLTFSNGYAEEAVPAAQTGKTEAAAPVAGKVVEAAEAIPAAAQVGNAAEAAPAAVKAVKVEEAAPAVAQVGKAEEAAPAAGKAVKTEEAAPAAVQVGKAEEAPSFAEQVGKWTFSMNEAGPDLKKLSPASRTKIRKQLQEIAGMVTATSSMTPPKGFEARFWGSIAGKDRLDICTARSCPPPRANAVLAMMIGRYEAKGGKRRAAFNTPSTMDISVNNLGHVFAHLQPIYQDKDGFLLPEPQRDGERFGMPAYLNNGHAIAVLTRSSKPLWLPVTRERYLQAAMEATGKELGLPPTPEAPPAPAIKGKKKAAEKGKKQAAATKVHKGKPVLVDEGKTWVDAASDQELIEKSRSLADEVKEAAPLLQERLAQLQAEFAALTPEQRKTEARVEVKSSPVGMEVTLLPPDSSSGVAVVSPNFGFFEKKLAPEAIQLIVVQWKFDGNPVFDPEKTGITENLNNRTLLDIYKNMAWQKLVGKITQTAP